MGLDDELWDILEDGVDDLDLDEEGAAIDRKIHTPAQKKLKVLYQKLQEKCDKGSENKHEIALEDFIMTGIDRSNVDSMIYSIYKNDGTEAKTVVQSEPEASSSKAKITSKPKNSKTKVMTKSDPKTTKIKILKRSEPGILKSKGQKNKRVAASKKTIPKGVKPKVLSDQKLPNTQLKVCLRAKEKQRSWEPESKTPEQDESTAGTHDSEDASESDQPSDNEKSPEAESSPEAEPTSEAQDGVASDEGQDDSEQANQSKNTFKYKLSQLEDQIIGNKESPKKNKIIFQTRRVFDGIVVSN
ncbi:nucleolar protein dao-5-like [Medicago truncatula]|uniref:nucleolar protein dao-5-like n=1 Tax=Medicago truncatula TaxID=3880 RepID=UPI001967EA17|nr:nucleolar protein dao-5-like [Medicago truncatula]